MKFMVRLFLGTLILLSTYSFSYAQNKQLDWLDGRWSGIGFQPSGYESSAWEIEFSYNKITGEAVIVYPTLECAGIWELESADKNLAVFKEQLKTGLDMCENGGKVVITRIDDNFITVSYFYPELYNGVVSFSTLERLKK